MNGKFIKTEILFYICNPEPKVHGILLNLKKKYSGAFVLLHLLHSFPLQSLSPLYVVLIGLLIKNSNSPVTAVGTWNLMVNQNIPTQGISFRSRHMIITQSDLPLSCQVYSCLRDFALLVLSVYEFLPWHIHIAFLPQPPFHHLALIRVVYTEETTGSLCLNEFLYFLFTIYNLNLFYFLYRI